MKATLKDVLLESELKSLKYKDIPSSTLIKDLTVSNLFSLMYILSDDKKYNSNKSIQARVLDELTERCLLIKKPIF